MTKDNLTGVLKYLSRVYIRQAFWIIKFFEAKHII